MTSIEKAWRAWEWWWTRTAPPHGLAIIRIVYGAFLLLYWGVSIPEQVPMFFSEAGLVLPYDHWLPEPLRWILTPPPLPLAWLLFFLLLASLLLFTIGAATRRSALFASLLVIYYINLSLHHYSTSYNRLFLLLLLLFTFSDAGKAFSLEMWRKYRSVFAWESGSVLTQRLIALQITATYLGVGWQKIWLPDWQGGEVLYYSFQGMWATPLAWWFVNQSFPLWVYDLFTFLVTFFEILLPFGLWIPGVRLWFMLGGLLFHVGVSLFLAAIWWFYPMVASYLLFFEPEEVYGTLQRWMPAAPPRTWSPLLCPER